MISRRNLIQHGVAATALAGVTVAAVQCHPTEAPAATGPDAELLALGAEFDRLFVEYKRLDGIAYQSHQA